MNIIDAGTAAVAAAVVTGLFVIFHVLVIVRVIPSSIVWGGRDRSRREIVQLELVSIALLAATGSVYVFRAGDIATGANNLLWAILIWVVAGLFALNSVGNLMARTRFERFAFTPVTVVLTLLALRLALHYQL